MHQRFVWMLDLTSYQMELYQQVNCNESLIETGIRTSMQSDFFGIVICEVVWNEDLGINLGWELLWNLVPRLE